MTLKIKKLRPDAPLPTRATEGAAGMDLRADVGEDGITLQPMQRMLIPTGIAVELPGKEMVALVFARSGLALKQGLTMANAVGVVDSDYRGEISVPVINLSTEVVHIARGQRIAQLVLTPVLIPERIEWAEELSETERGAGGFGSTGVE